MQKWLTGTLDTALVDALSVSAGLSILVNNKGWDRGFAIASCLLALLGALSPLRTGWRALNEKGFTSRRANLSLGGQSILNLVSAVMNFVAGAGSANLPGQTSKWINGVGSAFDGLMDVCSVHRFRQLVVYLYQMDLLQVEGRFTGEHALGRACLGGEDSLHCHWGNVGDVRVGYVDDEGGWSCGGGYRIRPSDLRLGCRWTFGPHCKSKDEKES